MALGLLASVLLLAACAPVYLHVPPDLAESTLADDVRGELRRVPLIARLAPAGRVAREDRDVLLFSHLWDDASGRDGGPRALRLPDDRQGALESAAQWLSEETDLPILVVVPDQDARRQGEAGRLREVNPAITILTVSTDGDAEQSMAGVRREIHRNDGLAGILILSGDFGVSLARVISNSLPDPPPLVLELLFAAHGTRLRRAGIRIAGAVVIDLAETVRTLDKDPEASEYVYMVSRFVRY